ncbi:MAG: protein kinase [Candidatus Eisenbacteria bacterium]|uniref:non-specific serine/threonine protein kinase n=1 Tax=Eiseniibacteriota bacterium TaxID=2212470 RepID=A0A956M0M6_UNCEI|nr:protein kinase [Candidatus Eisenbacteria bacterium]
MIGKSIQGFRILEVRDAGAMGVVYKAQDPHLPRVVAIKVMNRALVDDEVFLERFRLEARALAMVQSPHIVTVHQLIDTPDDLAIVMEYVDGRSLQVLAEEESLSWQRTCRLLRQVLLGLAQAHEAGIVHRDVKPSNVLVLKDDTVKIVDFGLAKSDRAGRNLTQTGASAGTLYYMSPEQVHELKDVDARSDLYSVGMSFYKLLCGRLPFESTTSNYEILKEIVERDFPPADHFNPLLPPALVDLLAKSLQKKATDRFQSAREMIEALDEILSAHPSTTDPRGSGLRRSLAPSSIRGTESRSTPPAVADPPDGGETRISLPPSDRHQEPPPRAASAREETPRESDASLPPPVRPSSTRWRRPLTGVGVLVLLGVAALVVRSLLAPGEPEAAHLSIVTHPDGARVYVDGVESGLAPLLGFARDPGPVHVRVIRDGYLDRDSTFVLTAGDTTAVSFALRPVPTEEPIAPTPQTALSLEINPWGRVWLDDRPAGGEQVRSESFPVEPGTIRVRVRHPELGTWERRITVKRGESRPVQVDFDRRWPVVVTSQSAEGGYLMGEIFVDGIATGDNTPKEIKLRSGEHAIEVRRPGYTCKAVRLGVYGAVTDPIRVVLQAQ